MSKCRVFERVIDSDVARTHAARHVQLHHAGSVRMLENRADVIETMKTFVFVDACGAAKKWRDAELRRAIARQSAAILVVVGQSALGQMRSVVVYVERLLAQRARDECADDAMRLNRDRKGGNCARLVRKIEAKGAARRRIIVVEAIAARANNSGWN